MIFIPILLFNLLTVIFAFKEAVLYSRKGSDAMTALLGEKYDHAIWMAERGVAMHLFASALLIHTDVEYAIVIVSWLAQFIFLHQLSYNYTMVVLKMPGYKIGIAESSTTTAKKTDSFVKITLFVIGIIGPIAYYLI